MGEKAFVADTITVIDNLESQDSDQDVLAVFGKFIAQFGFVLWLAIGTVQMVLRLSGKI